MRRVMWTLAATLLAAGPAFASDPRPAPAGGAQTAPASAAPVGDRTDHGTPADPADPAGPAAGPAGPAADRAAPAAAADPADPARHGGHAGAVTPAGPTAGPAATGDPAGHPEQTDPTGPTGDPADPAGRASATSALAGFAAAPPGARSVTLEEAVTLSVAQHQRVVASAYAIDQAEAERKQTRGNLLPKLRVEAGVQFWDSEQTASLGAMPGLPIAIPPFKVRDAITWNLMVAVVQPLTAFWTIWEAHEVGKIGVDVRRLERETAQRERAGVVAESYLRVLQAREMAGITAQSLEQRRGQVARARALVDEGVIRKDDLLRARLGEADARQQVARASRQVRLAEANLSLVVGVREGQPAMDARPLKGPLASDLTAPPALLTVAEAQALALRSRTEVTTVSRQVAQARGAVAIARSKLLPEVSAIAAFQTSGGSELQSGDQFFFGLNLTWNVWEWGAVWYGVDAASATVRRAEEGLSELREGVRLQVLAAHESARTARELTLLAADAVTIAEENFRLAEVRYQERAATSFDVLDAETQLTQARAQLAAARYEFLIARAGLHRAMGLAPRAIARGGVSR